MHISTRIPYSSTKRYANWLRLPSKGVQLEVFPFVPHLCKHCVRVNIRATQHACFATGVRICNFSTEMGLFESVRCSLRPMTASESLLRRPSSTRVSSRLIAVPRLKGKTREHAQKWSKTKPCNPTLPSRHRQKIREDESHSKPHDSSPNHLQSGIVTSF